MVACFVMWDSSGKTYHSTHYRTIGMNISRPLYSKFAIMMVLFMFFISPASANRVVFSIRMDLPANYDSFIAEDINHAVCSNVNDPQETALVLIGLDYEQDEIDDLPKFTLTYIIKDESLINDIRDVTNQDCQETSLCVWTTLINTYGYPADMEFWAEVVSPAMRIVPSIFALLLVILTTIALI